MPRQSRQPGQSREPDQPREPGQPGQSGQPGQPGQPGHAPQARRPGRGRRPSARPAPTPAALCPCGHSQPYEACCGRLHRGEAAATSPEELMRSRYSAFARRDEAYLLRTWHPRTRPPRVEFDPAMRWTGLDIEGTADGTAFHSTGTVTFRAHYTDGGRPGALHERSRFERVDGAWAYVDGDFID